jgi:hypothetical protein
MDFMPTIYQLKRQQWLRRPVHEVFGFFSNALNLETLTPSWLRFAVVSPQPIQLYKGATILYRLKWHGIPLHWKTEITRWEPAHAFDDLQISGPYRLWHHTHTFEEVNGGTLMTDTVRYALPFGFLGRIAHALTVRRNVEQIFDYRHRQIEALFG